MITTYLNIFSSNELEYLMNLPEVLEAKEKLSSEKVYFTISLTEAIRNTLESKLGLELSNISKIPIRWIKGDTAPHIDTGSSKFENTYLVYLNDSEGEFIVNDESYPITANTAFKFREGLFHTTRNTGSTPRLLLGPMNEFANSVGGGNGILYYHNYANAFTNDNLITNLPGYILGDTWDNDTSGISSYTSWRVARAERYLDDIIPITIPALYTSVYNNGSDLFSVGGDGIYYVYPANPCFKEGTKVLCKINDIDAYVPIETLKIGTLVKTSLNGYKKIEIIGKGKIQNPGNSDRIEDRLYKCSPQNYHELKEDLFITGNHSILVRSLTDEQRKNTIKHLKRIFMTDTQYRLIACIDDRAIPWNSEGLYTIYHLALENTNPKMNYGIYVNGGLLVETCAIETLQTKSNMVLQ
jgi:hypothetical protein